MDILDIFSSHGDHTASAAKQSAGSDRADGPLKSADAREGGRRGKEKGESFESALREAMGEGERARSDFKRGGRVGRKEVDDALDQAVDTARAALPEAFKSKVGMGLMAQGDNSLDSMKIGSALMGAKTPAGALKGMLESLGPNLKIMKLDQDALPQLGQVLADSGLDDEQINNILSDLAAGACNMQDVLRALGQASGALSGLEGQEGLTATEEALPALGQFFMSLGLSPEVAKSVTDGFKPGDPITGDALRSMIAGAGDNTLAPCLSDADAENLANMLESMGATPRDLNNLWDQLAKTKGQMSLEGFLKFVDGAGQAAPEGLSETQLGNLKALMDSMAKETKVAKTISFDEAMIKLSMLGDREIDENFKDMSPALQALRGGISSQRAEIANGGGQGGNFGQGGGGQGHDEHREKYRNALNAQINNANNPVSQAVQASLAENLQSYGGQEALARQISQKMLYSARQGVHRLKMNLNPEDLGQLDIEMKVENGKLTAHIRAENEETYKALGDEIESLKEALAAGGLDIANMTISYDNQNSGQREFADLGLREESLQARADAEAPELGAAEMAAMLRRNPEGLLDRLV